MLTRVDFINPQGDVLSLPLSDYSGGYLVRNIDGLDPVKATLVSSSMAQVDGAQPQSSSRGTRNIVMKIGIKPNYVTNDVLSLRSNLYSWFMPKQIVTINFYFDNALYATSVGTVESCTNSMFSADQEVDISLICYDPDFYSTSSVTVNGTTVTNVLTQAITYPGTSDCGVIFTLTVSAASSGFTLNNTRPDGTLQTFQVTGVFQAGDVVTVTSIPRQKSLMLTRAGVTSSILYYLQAGGTWISLGNGKNKFQAFSDVGAMSYTVAYTPKYGGF